MATKVPTETTLGNYQSSTYGKELFLSKAKVGKTVALVGNALGVFKWNEYGGVVDKPENLHILTVDAAALSGCFDFLVNECGASKEIAKAKVYNLQRQAEKAFTSTQYSLDFPNAVTVEMDKIRDRASKGGTHVLIVSSLTMLAKAWLRSISGPALRGDAGSMFKSPMDQNKWNLFKQQMAELQWQTQSDLYHTFWEAHHGEKTFKDTATGMDSSLDTLQVDGSTARSFPANVERIWEIKRTANPWKDANGKVGNKSVHEVYFDPFPRFDFGDIQTGRKVSGTLEPKEIDLPYALNKLGLDVGGWGS